MDDKFLYEFREAPRPAFAESLRKKLSLQPEAERAADQLSHWRRWAPILSLPGILAVMLAFPSLRVAAQHFLDLFRVQRFVAVSIDSTRLKQLQQLKDGSIDIETVLSRNTQVLKEPGAPKLIDDPKTAGQIAGILVRLPIDLPLGVSQADIRVQGEGSVRFTADTIKLQELLDFLGITDVQVPQQLNGATVTVNVSPTVKTRYTKGSREITLTQSRSPEIILPPGVFLPEIVEIFLRVAGLTSEEGHRLAYSMDWHGTLLVPVPANAASFQEVNIRGNTGLLIESSGGIPGSTNNSKAPRRGAILLWSEEGIVYSLSGEARKQDLLELANSM
jgi:Domain of unknown function (DUF4367)